MSLLYLLSGPLFIWVAFWLGMRQERSNAKRHQPTIDFNGATIHAGEEPIEISGRGLTIKNGHFIREATR